jgi:chromosome segregation ATPase
VHVNRLKKAYTDDSTSLQSYSQQLEAAQQELDSISQAQQDMITRHMEVKDKISQLQALAESHTDKIQSCGTSVLSSEQTVPDNAEVEDSTYAVDMVELWEL